MAFFATHSEDGNPEQYIPQPQSMSLYANATVPLPPSFESPLSVPPFLQKEFNEARIRYRWRHDKPIKHQKMMKNVYRMATEVDTACGSIIAALERQGILDETLVIFTTDNGMMQGEHGLAGKWYPHEESIRVPLIIRDPRMPREKVGQLNHDFTLNVDLASTMLAAAGIDSLENMQGRDIAQLYLDNMEYEPWREEFYYEHPALNGNIPQSQALVRKDFKLFRWPEYNLHQLFNVQWDPFEEYDLSKNTTHASVVKGMKKRLDELSSAAF